MHRSSYLGALLWVVCLGLGLWSSQLSLFESSDLVRDAQLDKIQESLDRFAQALAPDSGEAQFIQGAIHNLNATREGSSLVDRNALIGISLLSVIALGLAVLVTLSGQGVRLPPQRSRSQDPVLDGGGPQTLEIYRQHLRQTADDLQMAFQELSDSAPPAQEAKAESPQLIVQNFDQIVRIESHLTHLRTEVTHTMQSVKDIAERLQRLSAQCEDNSHFTSATRLEWNAMGNKLRQMKESHNKLKSTSDKMSKQQLACHELITKSLAFSQRHDKHAESARDQVLRMNDISKETLGTLDLLASSMAESNKDVGHASALVRGLSERAEEIVNIIDVIDDIAEQTNQLALNASIEAARAGEQGQGFAVVAGEVRNLAARSSTATKSITDLLGTIQLEADHASGCLEKSRKSVELAHHKMLEVDHSYRETVSISRIALGELNNIIATSIEHLQELKAIEKQSHELKKYYNSVQNQLDEHGRIATTSSSECNQLTIHSDRLSRLLTRQYFEISHCDRMVEGAFFSLDHLKGRLEESLANADGLRRSFQESYESSLKAPLVLAGRGGPLARTMATLQAARRNLEVISSPPEAVQHEFKDLCNAIKVDDALGNARAERSAQELPKDDVLIGDANDRQKVI